MFDQLRAATARRPSLSGLPCDRGGAAARGLHHFQAGHTGVVCCIYCGQRPPASFFTTTNGGSY